MAERPSGATPRRTEAGEMVGRGAGTRRGPVGTIELLSPISLLVLRPAVRVDASAPLPEAARRMRQERVSSVLVESSPVRILTERDLARALADEASIGLTAGELGTPHPVTVSASTSVVSCAALMLNQDVRHLLVDLGDGLIGVVSLRAVMAVLLQAADPHLWWSHLRIEVSAPPEAWWG